MNFTIPFLPQRPAKPRQSGITMVMDKGLSVAEAENLVSASGHLIDFVKLGFGTSLITGHLEQKIACYKSANIRVYLGGTLFEAFVIRNAFEQYVKLLEVLKLDTVEISDGSMRMSLLDKCNFIKELSKNFYVISEVGSKDASVNICTADWVRLMQAELDAGSSKVIAEARESGNVGIFDANCKANTNMIGEISSHIDANHIIWEAPIKAQQVWFIKQFGSNVNLGNIASGEVIALETLRLGLRGDTFHDFLPDNLKQ
ncbi:MAG: phosphosulfolactate synthase [Bacteroidota bacterium]